MNPESPVQRQRVAGLDSEIVEAIAVYEVEGERIKKVWFF